MKKFIAECDCGKTELSEKELREGKENGCILCDKCGMPKIIESIEDTFCE